MGNELKSSDSFICYNCKEKNFFDKTDYLVKNQAVSDTKMRTGASKVKEVSIECKSCRETNNVLIEY
jgi:hypothetical protein